MLAGAFIYYFVVYIATVNKNKKGMHTSICYRLEKNQILMINYDI